MIKINQIKLPVTHSDEALKKKIIKMLKLNAKTGFTYRILKKSLDARKKPELFYTYSVAVEIEDTKNSEEAIVKRAASSSVLIYKEKEYMIPACGHIPLDRRPVIAGAGPAGTGISCKLTTLDRSTDCYTFIWVDSLEWLFTC